MRKIYFVASMCLLVISACKKNTTEEPAPAPVGFQWPVGTGDYAPYTNGSTFTFETSTGTPAVIDSFTYTVAKDTPINGTTYRKLISNKPALAATYFTNISNNIITEISYNINFQGLVTVPVITQTVLKDNVALNATWTEPLVVSVPTFGPVTITFTYTLMQKDFTKNILTKDYLNSYEVKQVASIDPTLAALAGIPSSTTINNFYSKGIGRVQRDATTGTVKIKRYNVIK
jgi:hypothetical protein